jgi:hypothetical protein
VQTWSSVWVVMPQRWKPSMVTAPVALAGLAVDQLVFR